MGQHYQWLEANLVFHVAHKLSRKRIPAITVHNDFIVRERDKEITEELTYSLLPENLPTLAAAPWNKALQTQHKAAGETLEGMPVLSAVVIQEYLQCHSGRFPARRIDGCYANLEKIYPASRSCRIYQPPVDRNTTFGKACGT